jgi:hypothetical protein
MTLPFVSYGGSSVIAAGSVGMLLALTRARPQGQMGDVFGRAVMGRCPGVSRPSGPASADRGGGHGGAYVPGAGAGRGDAGAQGWRVKLSTDDAGRALCGRLSRMRSRWKRWQAPPLRAAGWWPSWRCRSGLRAASVGASGRMLRDKPAVVVGFGGYPSIPALAAAWVLRRPRMIHEQNGVLGRVNRSLRAGWTGWPAGHGRRPAGGRDRRCIPATRCGRRCWSGRRRPIFRPAIIR